MFEKSLKSQTVKNHRRLSGCNPSKRIRKVRLYTSVSLSVELCKELQALEVALEHEVVDVAVEVEQVEKLQFHLVEQLSGDPAQFRVVRVLEVKIIEVFRPH